MAVSGLPRNSGCGRIGELATLPVFFDLRGKPVLVAGESDGAAWKAELLASCGAEVHLFARLEGASEAIRTFAARSDVVHHDCSWEAAYFRHFALAVGDCAIGEGKAFHDRARQAGVPVNVIDQPEFCAFKFGSIVNRSPLVIGISTDGAAPILAQTVRRKIEALLPRQLKTWAELAQSMRGRVNRLLETASSRRFFWERFADLAFDAGSDPRSAETLISAAGQSSAQAATGRVSLVGAGPGDAELITLKAVRALQSADVILFDHRIPAEILELARREARRVEVTASNDVVVMASDLVDDGKRVVRLVPGDPSRSPHARAEMARLRDRGISVDAIPGVEVFEEAAVRSGAASVPRIRAGSVNLLAGRYHRGGAPLPSAPTLG